MYIALSVGILFVNLCEGLRLNSGMRDIDLVDISNCTWTEWSVCSLASQSRCARSRTLDLLPAANQTMLSNTTVPCSGQAGRVDSVDCVDGLCPSWQVGNWSDCSNTCNSTLSAWAGYQVRNVDCTDTSGVFYRREVCESVRGAIPISEQACPCSHTIPEFNPYKPLYTPIG